MFQGEITRKANRKKAYADRGDYSQEREVWNFCELIINNAEWSASILLLVKSF